MMESSALLCLPPQSFALQAQLRVLLLEPTQPLTLLLILGGREGGREKRERGGREGEGEGEGEGEREKKREGGREREDFKSHHHSLSLPPLPPCLVLPLLKVAEEGRVADQASSML